jgi:hypothetical protein
VGTKWQRFTIDLSNFDESERDAIAIEVIDRIKRRTQSGLDKNGDTFAPYSKAYRESLEFKIAGKTAQVDLTLSEDMLDSLQILENKSNGKVVIGYQQGSAENGKADGNIRGTYGRSAPVAPGRDFLGISSNELESITSKYEPGAKSTQRTAEILTSSAEARRLSAALNLQDITFEEEG